MKILYLTKQEKKVIDALPASLFAGCDVREESEKGMETLNELKMRYCLASFGKHPAIQAIAEHFIQGTDLSELSLKNIPDDIASEFFFTIGAKGVTGMMGLLIADGMKSSEDIHAFTVLSVLRHGLLENNRIPLSTHA